MEHGVGRPLAGARIRKVDAKKSAYHEGMMEECAVTSQDGHANIPGGTFRDHQGVLVELAGFVPEYLELAPDRLSFVVEMKRGFSVIARCQLLDGSPVIGARVGLVSSLEAEVPDLSPLRPGPQGIYPSTWAESDESGIVTFQWLPRGRYFIQARVKDGYALAKAGDSGSLELPQAEVVLMFAPVYVNVGVLPRESGDRITYRVRLPVSRLSGPLEQRTTHQIAEDLRIRWPSAIVWVMLLDDRVETVPPLEGEVLTTHGWHKFRSGWQLLRDFQEPIEWECTPTGPKLHWGDVAIKFANESGDPCDVHGVTSLAQGGALPSLQVAYKNGSRVKIPIGQYRVDIAGQAFLTSVLSRNVVEVRESEFIEYEFKVPKEVVLADVVVHVNGVAAMFGYALEVYVGSEKYWLGPCTPKRSKFYLPAGMVTIGIYKPDGSLVKKDVNLLRGHLGVQKLVIDLP